MGGLPPNRAANSRAATKSCHGIPPTVAVSSVTPALLTITLVVVIPPVAWWMAAKVRPPAILPILNRDYPIREHDRVRDVSGGGSNRRGIS
ncbi:hypothetical protein AGRA671_19570 [Agrobacterium radiobacter]|nr:Uncharacterised protein [Agrobacterium tumefaciens]